MHFHFSHINHNIIGVSTLNDMYDWFHAGLTELGHRVTRSDALDSSAINILWENFRPGMGESLRAANIRYGIIATEIPDPQGGFNWRSDDPWPLRFASFAETANGAMFIWSMIEDSCSYYAQYAPCSYMELGFSEALVPRRELIDRNPTYEFGFFGLRTPYRQKLIDELSRHCKVLWPDYMASTSDVIEFISNTRIGLNFRQSEAWPIPSPTRLGRYLHAKRLLVSERTTTPTRQGLLVEMTPTGTDFREFCLSALDFDWRSRADAAFEKYKSDMPMHHIMQRALDLTLTDVAQVPGRANKRPQDSMLERLGTSLSSRYEKIAGLFGRGGASGHSHIVAFEDDKIWHQPAHVEFVNDVQIVDYAGHYYCIERSRHPIDLTDKLQRRGIASFRSIDDARQYASHSTAI